MHDLGGNSHTSVVFPVIRSRIDFWILGPRNIIRLSSIKSCSRELNRLSQAEFLQKENTDSIDSLTLKNATLNLHSSRLSL